MRSRVFFKLLGAFVLVIAIATVILDFAVRREWDSSLRQQITESLTEKTRKVNDAAQAASHEMRQNRCDQRCDEQREG